MAPEGAIDYAPVTVCLKAYPDTNLYGRGTPDPLANLRAKVPELFVSRVSKIARPGHPGCGKADSSPLKRFGMTKGKKFSGIHAQRAFTVRPKRECRREAYC